LNLQAHVSRYEFYGQVGDGHEDHSVWSRPEDWTKPRPAWKLTQQKPGSEVLAETAAALAAASIVFRSADPFYQSTLLTHARQLYEFADQYRGRYSDSIPNVSDFYNSWTGYGDELGWAAAWLLRATGDQRYQADVDRHYAEFDLSRQPYEFSWDDKTAGLQVLMAKLTQNQTYRQQAEKFCNYVVRQAPRTPKGLVFLGTWGALRHASNAAFLCLQVTKNQRRQSL
jgi:endoglucanase